MDETNQPEAMPIHVDAPVSHPQPHLTPVNFLLLAGSSLIVVAVFILISVAWSSFSPLGRMVVAILPLLFLYGIAFANWRNAAQQMLVNYTVISGSIIFPFVLGVIIIQSGAYTTVDATLIYVISLISFVWYLCLEFILGNIHHTPFTVTAAISAVLAYLASISADPIFYSLAGILLAAIFLPIGWHADRKQHNEQASLYTNAGAVAGWIGLASLPYTYLQSQIIDQTMTVLYLLVSAIMFVGAVIYSAEWQRTKSPIAFAVRQLCENSAALFLTIPAIGFCISNTSNTLDALVTIALGIISLGLSFYVKVRIFRLLGVFSIMLGAFMILLSASDLLRQVWPITMLLIGFVLIGTAYYFQKHNRTEIFSHLVANPAHSLFGLGIQPEITHDHVSGTVQSHFNARSSWLFRGCLFLLAIYLILMLFSWLTFN